MKGFTLIELIVTIAILGIVLASVGQFFSFNLRTYSKGEKLAQVQFDVRMASDYITSELRNVSKFRTTLVTGDEVINLTGLQSKYPSVNALSFTIERKLATGPILVKYKITGNSSDLKNPYLLESQVLLNNYLSLTEVPVSTNTVDAVYYLD